MSLSMVTGLNPRARHEATNASTHAAWNCPGYVDRVLAGQPHPR